MGGGAADELARAVRRLVDRVSHWTPSRWTASSGVTGDGVLADGEIAGAPEGARPLSRADLLYGLVQEVADLAADAEGQPRRPVPRLDNHLALPDQLRVVAADLVAAASTGTVLRSTAARINAVGRALLA